MAVLNGTGLMVGMLGLAMLAAPVSGAEELKPDPYRVQPEGALKGASIFLSAGHGWYWNEKQERWVTQRSSVNGIIEDHCNAEMVMQYLLPYLWNSGANIYTSRERDFQTNEVILEAGKDKAATPFSEGVHLSGSWDREVFAADEVTTGVLKRHGVWNLDAYSANSVRASGKGKGLLTVPDWPQAVFRPNIPEAGYYSVTVHYRPSTLGETSEQVEFQVYHSGGTSIWKQNQNQDGYTWKNIGTYYFEAGTDGYVVIPAATRNGKGRVVVDAVRFGGGMGDFNAPDGLPSGKPRWEESALYHTQFLGFHPGQDSRAGNFGTVRSSPLWSEWEMEAHERGKAMYLSWHGNAFKGTSRGLFGFVYGPEAWSTLEIFSGIPGSIEMTDAVINEIARDVHASYDPTWRIGDALVTAWFGEINPFMNTKMPAGLIEVGFFDNVEDAKYMLDPQFRRLAARATYQGIVEYYSENVKGFKVETLVPEPPTNFRVRTNSKAQHVLEWNADIPDEQNVAGDKAERFVVYSSYNGYGFDNGTIVRGTSITIAPNPERPAHLKNVGVPEVVPSYYRVAALNSGGESLPSETLAVGMEQPNSTGTQKQERPILLVYGYDRLDAGLNFLDGDGATMRGILSKMNTRDYTVPYANVLLSENKAFHSTSNEAVEAGQIKLQDYETVFWILGQEKGATQGISETEQQLIKSYVEQGGGLFISGSEAFFETAQTDDGKAFLEGTLGIRVASDNSGTRQVISSDEGLYAGLGELTLNDGNSAGYVVQSPDVLTPAGPNSQVILEYADGKGAAAVQTSIPGKGRVMAFGFPVEMVLEENLRHKMILRSTYALSGTLETLLSDSSLGTQEHRIQP